MLKSIKSCALVVPMIFSLSSPLLAMEREENSPTVGLRLRGLAVKGAEVFYETLTTENVSKVFIFGCETTGAVAGGCLGYVCEDRVNFLFIRWGIPIGSATVNKSDLGLFSKNFLPSVSSRQMAFSNGTLSAVYPIDHSATTFGVIAGSGIGKRIGKSILRVSDVGLGQTLTELKQIKTSAMRPIRSKLSSCSGWLSGRLAELSEVTNPDDSPPSAAREARTWKAYIGMGQNWEKAKKFGRVLKTACTTSKDFVVQSARSPAARRSMFTLAGYTVGELLQGPMAAVIGTMTGASDNAVKFFPEESARILCRKAPYVNQEGLEAAFKTGRTGYSGAYYASPPAFLAYMGYWYGEQIFQAAAKPVYTWIVAPVCQKAARLWNWLSPSQPTKVE